MNYEEKYKEALERAKKVKHDIENIGCSMAPDMLEVIFPELAESEDEKIRKAIIHYILYETKGTISEATEHTWVKWLEKQKEQKPADDKAFEEWIDDWYQGSKEMGGDVVMSEAEFKNWSRGIRNMYAEQPAGWSEEDELAKKHLEGYIMGREDTMREMKDFIESHFNCENAKKGTPIVYNTQSGTSTLKAEG